MTLRPTYILFFIGLLPVIMVIGNSMFIPLLPQMQLDLRLSTVESGWLLTSFSIPAALFVPLGGVLSDRYGRKKVALLALLVIIVGCLMSALASLRVGSASVFQLMMAGRVFQGIGAGLVTPLAMVFISDIYEGEQRNRALGSIEVFNGMGKVVSPIIGGIILSYSWSLSFVVLLALSLFAFVGILLFINTETTLKKTGEGNNEKRGKVKMVFVSHWRWLLPVFSSGAVGMFLLFGYLFYFSYLLEATTLSSFWNGIFLAVPLFMLTVFSYSTARKLKGQQDSYRKSIILGLLLMTLGSAMMVSIPYFISLNATAYTGVDRLNNLLISDLPSFQLVNGSLYLDSEETFFTEEISEGFVLIDPNNKYSEDDLIQFNEGIALQQQNILFIKNGNIQTISYSLLGLNEFTNAELTKRIQDLHGFLPILLLIVTFLLFVGLSGAAYLGISIFAFIATLFKGDRASLQYRHLWTITAHAMTLPVIALYWLDTLLFSIPFSAFILSTMIFVIVAIRTIPKRKASA